MSINRVEDYLSASARHFGDKIALVASGRRLTFAELDALSDRVAVALKKGGVGRGDRVLVFMDNCWEAVVSIFAVLKADAVFSPVNPSTKADKLAYVANNCRAVAILTQARLMSVATEAAQACKSVTLMMVANADKGLPDHCVSFEAACEGDRSAPPRLGINLDLAML